MTARERAKRLIDSWPFWVGVAYFGLAAVTVALWVNYSRVSVDQQRTAVILAERGADVQAQYQVCLKSAPVISKFNRFVHGVQTVNTTLLQNSLRTHQATPVASPLFRIQIRNISRLRTALQDTSELSIPVTTRKQCLRTRNGRHAQ